MTNIPHNYPLSVRDSGLGTATSLLLRSMPYALMRFAILLACSFAAIVWLLVTLGGAMWAGTHIAGAFGFIWFITCVAAGGWVWVTLLRYALHLIECGHVAVLTELITRGEVGNESESMFAYGKRVVTERFGEVNALFGLNMLVRGIVNAVHSATEGIGSLLAIPGLDTLANMLATIMRAATRYIDKVIFSYNLARADENPWGGARDGLVYYAQNAQPILKQAIWIIVLEYILSALLWLMLLAPAAVLTMMMPQSLREIGGMVTIVVAVLLALAARGAFLKPLFLIMIMVRYHSIVEHQPLNQQWVAQLDGLSTKFRDLSVQAAQSFAPRGATAR